MLFRWLLACGVLVGVVPAQELLWQVSVPGDDYSVGGGGLVTSRFGDLDGDGSDDLLSVYLTGRFTVGVLTIRVFSGATGAILDDHSPPMLVMGVNGVGDFDGDGYPDYAAALDDQGFQNQNHLQVWSPHLGRELLRLSGPRSSSFAGRFAGRVDLDGDHLPDLIVASTHPSAPDVRAYSHTGALLYTVPLGQMQMLPLAVMGLQDLDNDGSNEILVGGTDYSLGYTRGMLLVLSGRTGAVLRATYDELQGDIMGYPIDTAGDMDRDGVEDYATGNFWGGSGSGRKILSVYSGATGNLIRQWTVPIGSGVNLSTTLIGGRDVDLDGVPDVIAGTHAWNNGATLRDGRVQAFSSRDQQLLLQLEPPIQIVTPSYAEEIEDLGVQPGSPYPVFAFTYRPASGPVYKRLEVWRGNPPGERVVHAGCGSTLAIPTVNVRPVTTAQGTQCRVVLGSAPAGAAAFCVAAAQHETTFAGSPLPLALDALGFPGCNLLVPPTLTELRGVGLTGFDGGYAGIDVPLQIDAAGFGAAVQWLVFDFNTGAFAATPRCEVHLR